MGLIFVVLRTFCARHGAYLLFVVVKLAVGVPMRAALQNVADFPIALADKATILCVNFF